MSDWSLNLTLVRRASQRLVRRPHAEVGSCIDHGYRGADTRATGPQVRKRWIHWLLPIRSYWYEGIGVQLPRTWTTTLKMPLKPNGCFLGLAVQMLKCNYISFQTQKNAEVV